MKTVKKILMCGLLTVILCCMFNIAAYAASLDLSISEGGLTLMSDPCQPSYTPVGAVKRVYVWQISSGSGVVSITYDNNQYCTVTPLKAGTATVTCSVTLTYDYRNSLGTMPGYEKKFGGSWTINVIDDTLASGKCGDNLTWTLNSGTLTIDGSGGMYHYYGYLMSGYAVPPWDGKSISRIIINEGVTAVGDLAFLGAGATTLSLPDSLTEIGAYSFASNNFTSVAIPKKCKDIYNGAFSGCTKLKAFTVNSGNSYFTASDGVLFSKDEKTLITYPAGKTDTEYTIPTTVTELGISSFEYCNNLKKLYIPDSVTTMQDNTIIECSNLTIYASKNSAAHTYATNNDIPFVAIAGDSVKITAFNVSPVSGLGLANISAENVPDSATVFIAAYNNKKALCEIQKVSLKDDGTGQTIITAQGVKNYKVFVWNPSTMKQLCNAAIYEVK